MTTTDAAPETFHRKPIKEKPMHKWLLIFLLPLLTACASQVPITASDPADRIVGTLGVAWLEPKVMEVVVDGKRYTGEWSSQICATDECRGAYRNVLRIHRRHIRKGHAVLVAADGSRVECEWVSHLPELEGTCKTQDGRVYKLKSA